MTDLVKTIDNMTDAELLEHIRAMRHRRETIRPAAARHVARAEKKVATVRGKKMTASVQGMSEEERLKLIALLTQGE